MKKKNIFTTFILSIIFIVLLIIVYLGSKNSRVEDNPDQESVNQNTTEDNNSDSKEIKLDNTLSGMKYNFELNYPSDWFIKSHEIVNGNVESIIIKSEELKSSFNLSIYEQDFLVTVRKDYEVESKKNITINNSTTESILYQPQDWSGIELDQKLVYVKYGDKPQFVIMSQFDKSKLENGWDVINNIISSIKML